jgi:hypothetical protein
MNLNLKTECFNRASRATHRYGKFCGHRLKILIPVPEENVKKLL